MFEGWYADPEAAIFDKQYWIYPTYSVDYNKQVLTDAFSPPDLVQWTKHPDVIDTAFVKWAKRAIWATAIMHKEGKYFSFFAANDIQKKTETVGIGVGVTEKPEGPYKGYLGEPLLNKIINKGQPIDQFVFLDKDGQCYMIMAAGATAML